MPSPNSLPPHDLDAEESLLGAMLLSHDAVLAAVENCSAADFYKPAHGHIFSAIVSLFEAGDPVDPVTVADDLRRSGLLELVGDPTVLTYLQANTASSASAGHYARIVAGHTWRRNRVRLAREIADATMEGDDARADRATEELFGDNADGATTRSSWEPVDLLNLAAQPVRTTALAREDGAPLLYEGKVHSLAGEPEAGKTHVALHACAQEIAAGHHVVFIDFEGGPADILERIDALGCDRAAVAELFHYLRPDTPFHRAERRRLEQLVELVAPTLVVIDGMAEALAIEGLDENSAADVTRWLVLLPRACSRAGAAVLLLDHLTKDRESRGRYARGSSAKLAGIDGAGFHLSALRPFARSHNGESRLDVVKDRHGRVREVAEGNTVATIQFISLDDGGIRVELHAPVVGPFRPTVLMERLSRHIEINPGLSQRELRARVQGKADALAHGLRLLVEEGYVATQPGPRGAMRHTSVRPFREVDDVAA